ncbi:hypothetical protein O181_001969 [Austropuccinia psidii MF-1]|uniref:Uncharacterized protein n=1 Tax=Austropuccinia psidii MF-1 TaxID=1389203 RepID=A0A9Q3BBH4_9BASI|nr:hypothetical protein [Austropuccinia psidii MF-1]
MGDWGERAYINVYRGGLKPRLLDQFDSHPGKFGSHQELMDITWDLDTRYHERQKEKSLLPSRDELFKEIKDVAISSIHLFQGDMKLLPLSSHSSLEEKWDEEEDPEEIAAVLKVVPPAYSQYLDAFSKVKEEKLCPHCACGRHIALEGPLPPVVFI